ncbi:MAG: hypothetical protein KJ955_00380 [Nanoarchaeota archaeon]|nr:hypothetical protein [Nanoarchaeota archaeon]
MDFLFLLPIVVFLGMPLGLLLAWMAKEELRPGRKWIKLFRRLLLLSLSLLSVYFLFKHSTPLVGVVGVASGIVTAVALNIFKHAAKQRFNYDYLFLGLLMAAAFASLKGAQLLVFSVLLFLYGLPFSSSVFLNSKKRCWKLTASHAALFFPPLLFLFLGELAAIGFGLAAIHLLVKVRG